MQCLRVSTAILLCTRIFPAPSILSPRTYLSLASHFTPYESRSPSTPSFSPPRFRPGYLQDHDRTNKHHLPDFNHIPDAGTSKKLLKAYQVIYWDYQHSPSSRNCCQPQEHRVLWAPKPPNSDLTIMMATSNTFIVRDDSLGEDDSFYTPAMANTTISILALIALVCCCFGAFFFLRRRRQRPTASLLPTHSISAHHQQFSISTKFDVPRHSSVYVYDEKRNLTANASSPACGRVPEIRITFPDEEGSSGRKGGGRVVIVKVGDSGTVGMEPLKQEFLPPYQANDNSRFQSLDLNRIGGMKEPERFA